MVEPCHSAGSTSDVVVETRGVPNSAVCQRAWKPSAVTFDVAGSTLLPKLGVDQVERMVASSSLPPYITLNAVVPRRLMVERNDRAPVGGDASAWVRATTSDAMPQGRSARSNSRQDCQAESVPLITIRSSERSPMRVVVVPKATKLSSHRNWPVRSPS